MISAWLLIVAGFVLWGAAFLAFNARTGEQQTLGWIVAFVALLIGGIGALASIAGL